MVDLPQTQWYSVDDGSTDSTLEILRGLEREHAVTVLTLPENSRKAEAVRRGMLHCLAENPTLPLVEFVDPISHWYYVHKSQVLLAEIGRFASRITTIVEVGAGSGFFCREVRKQYQCTAFCIDPNYSDDQIGLHDGITYTRQPPNSAGDLYLLIDVLEHVPDDKTLLQQYVDQAKPGATFAIPVPAFMALWNPHDEFLEHYRRYRLAEIEGAVLGCGLQVLHSRYFYGLAFAPPFAIRRVKRRRPPSSDLRPTTGFVNAVLTKVLFLEGTLRQNRDAGLSAMVIARKPIAGEHNAQADGLIHGI